MVHSVFPSSARQTYIHVYTRIADQLAGRRRARASTRVIRMGLGASRMDIRMRNLTTTRYNITKEGI